MSWAELGEYFNCIISFVLFQIKDTPVTVLSLLIFLVFISAFIFLGILARRTLNRKIFKKLHIDEGTGYTLSRITQYTIITIGALVAFQFCRD